jgi:membrane protein
MSFLIRAITGFCRKLYEAYLHWNKDDVAMLAAATSYYMALSFFPLLLLILSAMGFLLRFTGWGIDVRQRLMNLLAESVAPSLAGQVEVALSSVTSNVALSGPVGLIALFATAMTVFAQFERAFDRIWNIPDRPYEGILAAVRHILFQRLRAFLLLLGVWLLIIAAFIYNMTLSTMQTFATEHFVRSDALWSIIAAASPVATNWLLFAVLYKILPKAPVRWKAAVGGALLAAIVWEAGRRILAALVIGTHYSVYGVVGAFIAIMLWVYYAAATLFFAAEFVRVIGNGKLQKS